MQERIAAVRATIDDIVGGSFVKSSKDSSSKVISRYGVELRRVVLVGHVVGKTHTKKEREFASITLDDGTETIQAKAWDSDTRKLELVKQTENSILALVVGRVRQIGEEIYIDPEIVREVQDPNYLTLHKLERMKGILKLRGVSVLETAAEAGFEEVEQPVPQIAPVEEPRKDQQREKSTDRTKENRKAKPAKGTLQSKILAFIRENADEGGVPIEKIAEFFRKSGAKDVDINMAIINLQADNKIHEKDRPGLYLPDD